MKFANIKDAYFIMFRWFFSILKSPQSVAVAKKRQKRNILQSFRTNLANNDRNNPKHDMLLMEEILHHLGCIKPGKQWDIKWY